MLVIRPAGRTRRVKVFLHASYAFFYEFYSFRSYVQDYNPVQIDFCARCKRGVQFHSLVCDNQFSHHHLFYFLFTFFIVVQVQLSPHHHLLKRVLFSHCMALAPLSKSIRHISMGLFLGSVFCSSIYVSVLMLVPYCFDC